MARTDTVDREQRILDTAARLFVHYGYDKTTMSDIARETGISKGAIYLHFQSKDALLEGVIVREMNRYAETWLATVATDPQGGTIGGMYRNILVALSDNAFMSAMFKRDGRVLGNYLRKPDNFFRRQQFGGTRQGFVQQMQEAGLIRSDIDSAVVAHIMNMLAFALIGMDEMMDRADMPPVTDVINGLADFMDRALTPAEDVDPDKGKAVVIAMAEAARTQLDQNSTRP